MTPAEFKFKADLAIADYKHTFGYPPDCIYINTMLMRSLEKAGVLTKNGAYKYYKNNILIAWSTDQPINKMELYIGMGNSSKTY